MSNGAEWLKAQNVNMSPLGEEVANLMGELASGLYHIEGITRADWNAIHTITVTIRDEKFSTYDSDWLTRLVFLCHERDVRVSMKAAAFKYFRLIFTKVTKEGFFREHHPTLEEAIKAWRRD